MLLLQQLTVSPSSVVLSPSHRKILPWVYLCLCFKSVTYMQMGSASESVCMRATHLSILPPAGHTHLKVRRTHSIQNALSHHSLWNHPCLFSIVKVPPSNNSSNSEILEWSLTLPTSSPPITKSYQCQFCLSLSKLVLRCLHHCSSSVHYHFFPHDYN